MSLLENSTGSPELTVAMLPKSGEIVLLEMSQRFHMDHLEKVLVFIYTSFVKIILFKPHLCNFFLQDVAMNGCKDIHNILELVIKNNVKKCAAYGSEA